METEAVIKAKNVLEQLNYPLYFERKDLVRKLRENLLNDHFAVVIGHQGAGKSTLVNEGFRKDLEKNIVTGDAGEKWKFIWTNPLANPIGNLAYDLSRPDALLKAGVAEVGGDTIIENMLRSGNQGLVKVYEDTITKSDEPFNLVLAINQEQDLYRYRNFIPKIGKPGDDTLFIDLLLSALYSKLPIYTIFITDTENLSHFSRYRGMPEVINNFRFSVPQMTIAEVIPQLKKIAAPYQEDPFIQQLTKDYIRLSKTNDHHALYHLNHCVHYTELMWKALPDTVKYEEDAALKAYQSISKQENYIDEMGNFQSRSEKGLSEALNHHLESLFQSLNDQTAAGERLQKITQFMFKALTYEATNFEPSSRPVALPQLLRLCNRIQDDEVSIEDLQKIVGHFNDLDGKAPTKHRFLDVLGSDGQRLSEDCLLDINNVAILHQWDRLGSWTEQELLHANIYRALIRDAKNYAFKSHQTPAVSTQDNTPQSDRERMINNLREIATVEYWRQDDDNSLSFEIDELLYQGAQLSGAVDWKRKANPNETWAERYLPSEPTGYPKVFIQRVRNELKIPNGRSLTQLRIARWFVDASIDNEKKKREVETARQEQRLKKAKRLNRLILAISVIGIGVAVWGFIAQRNANASKRNLALIDFFEILDSYDVVSYDTTNDKSSSAKEAHELQRQIAQLDSIETNTQVINFLVKNKHLDMPNEEYSRKISYEALNTIGNLFSYLKKKPNGQQISRAECSPTIQDLEGLVLRAGVSSSGFGFSQYPMLYHALEAHIDVVAENFEHDYGNGALNWVGEAPRKATIATMVSIDDDKDRLIYGTTAGEIIKLLKNPAKSDPYEGYTLVHKHDVPIREMEYDDRYDDLLVATTKNEVFVYRNISIDGLNHNRKRLISVDEPIIDLEVISTKGSSFLLIGSHTKIYLFNLADESVSEVFDLPRELDIKWINDYSIITSEIGVPDFPAYIIAGGKDYSALLPLYKTRRGLKISKKDVRAIQHEGEIITSIAVAKISPRHNNWLAFGDETGSIWINADRHRFLGKLGENGVLAKEFSRYGGHKSKVTDLEYSKVFGQLASGGAEGSLILWNLLKMGEKEERILLKHIFNSVDEINYLGDQKLAVADQLDLKVISNGAVAQLNLLQKLLENKDQNCNNAQ